MKEALKLALEALEDIKGDCCGCEFEWNNDYPLQAKAHTAIKEALAQPEEAQSALSLFQSGFIDGREKGLKEALAQPEQEPVEWGVDWGKDGNSVSIIKRLSDGNIEVLAWEYAPHPPQRTWVGLTEEERNVITRSHAYVDNIIKATEAKLKEKNT